jgi:WD40 repeat protein
MVAEYAEHLDDVQFGTFSPSGRYVLSQAGSGGVRISETLSGRELTDPASVTPCGTLGAPDWVDNESLVAIPCGEWIAVMAPRCGAVGQLRPQGNINSVKWSSEGSLLASSDDFQVVLWDAGRCYGDVIPDWCTPKLKNVKVSSTTKPRSDLFPLRRRGSEDKTKVYWSPNRSRFLTGTFDRALRWFMVTRDGEVEVRLDHPSNVEKIAWHPAGNQLACATQAGVFIWNRTENGDWHKSRLEIRGGIDLGWHPNGTHFFVVTPAGRVHFFNEAKEVENSPRHFKNGLGTAVWHPKEPLLATIHGINGQRPQLDVWKSGSQEPQCPSGSRA